MEKIEQLIGKKVMVARKKLGLSQSDLAKNAKTSLTTINRLEKGHQFPHSSTLTDIASALGLTIAELYRDDAIPSQAIPVASYTNKSSLVGDITMRLSLLNEETLLDVLAVASGRNTSDARTSTLSAEDAEYLKLAKVIPLKILKKLVSDWDEVTENYFRAYLGFNSIEGEKKEAERAASKQKA